MSNPSDYTLELAAEICGRLAGGESLVTICRSDGMPCLKTVYRWVAANDEFRAMYVQGREDQADTLADQIIDIADDGRRDYGISEDGCPIVDHDHISRARLRVDARKWVASKLKPKKYGERVSAELTGLDGGPIIIKAEPLDDAL